MRTNQLSTGKIPVLNSPYRIGLLKLLSDDIEGAEEYFRDEIKLGRCTSSDVIEILFLQSSQWSALLEYQKAMLCFEVASNLASEKNISILCGTSNIAIKLTMYAKALELVESALAIDKTDIQSLELKGYIQLMTGDPGAADTFLEAFQQNPNNANLLAEKGLAELFNGNDEVADKDFTLALGMLSASEIKMEPDDIVKTSMFAKVGAAILCEKEGNSDEADELIDDLKTEFVNNAALDEDLTVLLCLGYSKINRMNTAKQYAEAFLERNPNSDAVKFHYNELDKESKDTLNQESSSNIRSAQHNRRIFGNSSHSATRNMLPSFEFALTTSHQSNLSRGITYIVPAMNRVKTIERMTLENKKVEEGILEKLNQKLKTIATVYTDKSDIHEDNARLTTKCLLQEHLMGVLIEEIGRLEKYTVNNAARFHALFDEFQLDLQRGRYEDLSFDELKNNHAILKLECLKLSVRLEQSKRTIRKIKQKDADFEDYGKLVQDELKVIAERQQENSRNMETMKSQYKSISDGWIKLGHSSSYSATDEKIAALECENKELTNKIKEKDNQLDKLLGEREYQQFLRDGLEEKLKDCLEKFNRVSSERDLLDEKLKSYKDMSYQYMNDLFIVRRTHEQTLAMLMDQHSIAVKQASAQEAIAARHFSKIEREAANFGKNLISSVADRIKSLNHEIHGLQKELNALDEPKHEDSQTVSFPLNERMGKSRAIKTLIEPVSKDLQTTSSTSNLIKDPLTENQILKSRIMNKFFEPVHEDSQTTSSALNQIKDRTANLCSAINITNENFKAIIASYKELESSIAYSPFSSVQQAHFSTVLKNVSLPGQLAMPRSTSFPYIDPQLQNQSVLPQMLESSRTVKSGINAPQAFYSVTRVTSQPQGQAQTSIQLDEVNIRNQNLNVIHKH